MPEDFLLIAKAKLKPQWKTAFLAAVIIGFLCHMFVFTNTLPNHDSLINTHSPQLKGESGRFFLSSFSGISSYFDLPWVNGALSIGYLALMAVLLTELFQLKKTFSILSLSGLLVTFPSIASTFSYMFTADGYMLGSLLTVAALLFTQKFTYGFIPGAIIFYLSVGIYQANLSFLASLILTFLLVEIIGRKITWAQVSSYLLRFFALGALGMSLYVVTFKLYSAVFSGTITSYQGLDSIGQNKASFFEVVHQIHTSFTLFFFQGFATDLPVNLIEWLNLAVFLLIAIGFVALTLQQPALTNKFMISFALLLLALMPLSSFLLYFMSSDMTYHMLMVFALVTFYLIPVLFYEHLHVPTLAVKTFSWAVIFIVWLSIFNFALISNISYLNMEHKYEKSTALVNRLISRIEQTENVTPTSKLALIGRVRLDSTLSATIIPENIPKMTGPLGDSIVLYPYHYNEIMQNYFGVTYEFASEEEHQALAATEAFAEMEAWPSPQAIRIINDIVVVKLHES